MRRQNRDVWSRLGHTRLPPAKSTHGDCPPAPSSTPCLLSAACASARAQSTKRYLFESPLSVRKPGGHVTPNDVMLNPMATFCFGEADDLLHILRSALDELTAGSLF